LLASATFVHAAGDGALPPRAQWHASASSIETPAMAAAYAIDGDTSTRWGGGFSPGNWFQVDLGRAATVGGVLIRWDYGAAKAYSIEDSIDGRQWHTAFRTSDATAGTEYIFFPAVQARFVRLASPARTADWGISMFEFEPIAQRDAPRISGVAAGADPAALWLGGQAQSLDKADRKPGARELDIELPRALSVAGVEIFWKQPPRSARLEMRDAAGNWQLLADDPLAPVALSFLAAPEAHDASALRLSVQSAADGSAPPAIERLRLLSATRVLSPMKRYEIAATRAHGALMPASLRQNQVYWTEVGVPAGRQKSVVDEYGDVEAFKGAPLVQPIWRDASGQAAAAFDAKLTHRLRDGWMPLPSVQWSPQPGLQLTSEAIAIEQSGAPVTIVRHRLVNTGDRAIEGQLGLVARPMQISPPWQNGGLSPIRDVVVDKAGASLRINGRVLFESLTPVDAAGAAAFGVHGEQEITRYAAAGTVPASASARDDNGLAAGLLSYAVRLAPGAHRDIVIAFALGNERIDPTAPLPAAPSIDRARLDLRDDAGAAFDRLADQVAAQWQQRVAKIGLTLPDQSLVDMLRAQAAYMLINQTGPAMQPGPRNYNRSFIRDGAATAAALLRMGMAGSARDYLHWYAEHAVHDNGLVSPILNDDGTVNTGFGSDIEYDSQGEFIWLVAEIARLDGGAASVREYAPKVKLAMKFLRELRERTLVPGYMAEREAPARFRGIIAPSISHEGYSTPTHSYWDDYWALKGWHDGAWLADAWGDRDTAKWAREQYASLHEAMAASIRATMQWKGSDVIPASADLGDPDPTSLSIALDPCGVRDLFPADALQRTFARYLDDVRKRDAPDALYAYTPYEMRNVLSYVHLDEPQQADELLMNLMRHRRPPEWQVLAEVVYSDLRHAIYLGDMPHTWIGSEYARAIFGMLMRDGDARLHLLPGAPVSWLQGAGLSVKELPVANGKLSMTARQDGDSLRVTLGPGLEKETALELHWPNRKRPAHVTIDGRSVADYTSEGIEIARPFAELTAQW
jgi:hypothetical protein